MTDFAAIDFETANECPSSICSVGLVIVRNGEIAESFYSLVHHAAAHATHLFTVVLLHFRSFHLTFTIRFCILSKLASSTTTLHLALCRSFAHLWHLTF